MKLREQVFLGMTQSLCPKRLALVPAKLADHVLLLGHAKSFREATRVPRYHQIMFLLALVLTGVVLGQVVRRVRLIAQDYAERLPSDPGRTY